MAEQRQIQTAQPNLVRPPAARPAAASDMMTPKEMLGIVRRHIWLIIFMTIFGLGGGGGSWYLLLKYYPKFTAEAYVEVMPPGEKPPLTISEVQVNKENLYDFRVSLASQITQQSTFEKLIARDKIKQTAWYKSFGDIQDKRIAKAVKDLKKHFGAFPQRNGNYIALSMTCGSDVESALIVNEMMQQFIDLQGGYSKAEIDQKLTGLVSQQTNVQNDLDIAEKRLDEIRKLSGFYNLQQPSDNFRDTVELKLNDLEIQQNELLLKIQDAEATIANLKKQAEGPVNEQIETLVETDPTTIYLTQQLASQESLLASRLAKFGDSHKVVREMRELINETKQKKDARKALIAEQLRQSNLKNAQDQMVVLAGRMEQLEKLREETNRKKDDLDKARVEYEKALAGREERKKKLDEIKSQIENYRIIYKDPETPKVRSLGLAPRPLEPSSPKLVVHVPAGFMLGMLLGIGLSFLIELLNDLVRTPKDVSRYLHVPLLGIIPDISQDSYSRKADLYQIVRQAPYSVVSESYRRLRTNLKLSQAGASAKVLLVASGMTGDGNTSVAVNLAATFASENKKVLIIDANFWQPRLASIFPPNSDDNIDLSDSDNLGLSDLLTGNPDYNGSARNTGIEGFDIIDAGKLPPHPAELLCSSRMETLIRKKSEYYDYVIIDGPPVLLVSAGKALARAVDGSILVFNASCTRRGTAQRTIREFREIDASIIGAVLVSVKAIKGGYFQEQFKSYKEFQKIQLAHSL